MSSSSSWSMAARQAPSPTGEAATQERPDPQVVAERLGGRCALITGGATGLGRAICLELAQRGTAIGFNYVNLPGRDVSAQALLTETAIKAHGVAVYSEHCDVRRPEEVEHFVTEARERLGGVHILINNAGVTHDGALWRLSTDSWQEVIDTNVTGAFNCIRAVSPVFRKQHFGKIVSVSAHQAGRPGFGVANYAASKAALEGLTRAAAVELGPANVNVNAVAPGFIRTERLMMLPREVIERAQKHSVLGRVAEPEDVAHVITFLCSDE
ncbi:MAG TPA: SDR family oxidoreductase, partial [Gemmatimonadales bacterium]|nr:SDR family oxidoreductase [Gemmatimonadales bacterium]